MAEKDEAKRLAGRYLDLWLDHWERSARDPEAVDALARMVQEAVTESADFHRRAAQGMSGLWPGMLTAPFGPWLEMMQQGAATARNGDETGSATEPREQPAREDGAEAAGTAPGAGAERVAQLLQRIAELESRIEHLERAGRPAAQPSAKRSPAARRDRPKRPR